VHGVRIIKILQVANCKFTLNIAMAPRTQGGHCQGRAELRDDASSARAQTKGSPHSRKSLFLVHFDTNVRFSDDITLSVVLFNKM
jgi:hypothetical protein